VRRGRVRIIGGVAKYNIKEVEHTLKTDVTRDHIKVAGTNFTAVVQISSTATNLEIEEKLVFFLCNSKQYLS
jgi:hypothetical protein